MTFSKLLLDSRNQKSLAAFLQRAHLRGLDELDGLLDKFLAYGQTTTSIVQSSPVAPRSLPLPDGTR